MLSKQEAPCMLEKFQRRLRWALAPKCVLGLQPSRSIQGQLDLQSFLLSVSSLLEDKVRYSVFHRIQYGMQTALSAVQRADPWRTAACSCFPLRRVFLTMLQLVLHIQPEVLWHQHTVCIRVRIPPVGRYLIFVVVIIYAMILWLKGAQYKKLHIL